MITMMYDPPSGWKFGFPKPYTPSNPLEKIRDTLIRDGYRGDVDLAAKHCRFWHVSEESTQSSDAAARLAVEGWPFGIAGRNPTIASAANDNAPVVRQPERKPAPGVDLYDEWPPSRPQARRGDWMQLYSGKIFYPMDPRADEIEIEDIAHSLSMQCRYAGHCIRFYSVAEHSVLLARFFLDWRDADLALWALLHDASEAYLVDVPRPVKPFLPGYKEAEARVMAAVCDRFGLPPAMPAEVHDADSAIIGDERANMKPCVAEWAGGYDNPLGVELFYWPPEKAEAAFLSCFREIQRVRQQQRRVG